MGELRQNPITDEWVVMSPERAKRLLATETKTTNAPLQKYRDDCPFCNLAKYPQAPDVLRLPNNDHSWQVHIFQNKYPAFTPGNEFHFWNEGPYLATNAVGYHELLVTRHHNHLDATAPRHIIELELEALVLRYRQLKRESTVNYIQIIKNHGKEAGASIEHPHHQIFSVPVLPSDVANLLHGTQRYAEKHGQKAFSSILEYEREHNKRIVFENEYFTAFCPYASRTPYETWIMPREHNPFFEEIGPKEMVALAESLQQVLGRMYTGLNNPPYNYYIHSAPCDEHGFVCDKNLFGHFRWHIVIMPRISTAAGFELGTGIEINTVLPEDAASFLRDQTLPSI